jgi:hypothetical protein
MLSTQSNLTTSKIERGVFYLSAPRRKAWQAAQTIAHEGRSESEACELMARASLLAAEQLLAMKGQS